MHRGQNHLSTNTSNKGGVRHPMCLPLEHLLQINMVVALVAGLHNIQQSPTRITTKERSI
jgi:hypothetical protein